MIPGVGTWAGQRRSQNVKLTQKCAWLLIIPETVGVSISAGILLPDLQTALLCSHLPTKCCKKSLGSGMRRDERETVSADSKQCSRRNYLEHKLGQNIHFKWK